MHPSTLFYDRINLSGDHRQTANTRKDDVVARLKTKFDVLDAFATLRQERGSY
jgi:hypothetical protein